MQAGLLTKTGRQSKNKITLDKEVFDADVNKDLLRQALYVYQTNQRQNTAHTKTRAEKRGGGAKPWRQKGTGRARAGSLRSPIWRGGGVTFGPRSEGDRTKKLTKKMRKIAIRSAFSFLAKEERITVMPEPAIKKERLTNQMNAIITNTGYDGTITILQDGKNDQLLLGMRNIPGVKVLSIDEVNVHSLLKSSRTIILQKTLDEISQRWGKTATTAIKAPEKTKPISSKS